MNDTMIDLYRAVQGRKGEWRRGDRCWHDIYGPGFVTKVFKYSLWVFFEKDSNPTELVGHEKRLLWLPPVWSEDGRCLFSMIEGDFTVERVQRDGEYFYCVDVIGSDFGGYYKTLPEALLRAIAEQEER